MSSYEPLHHKYRPQTFADLVGQEMIATTLTNAIVSRRIAPAYLFTGPRGTGKTSSARILAKSLNCQQIENPTSTPCGNCEICQAITKGSALDVIEIDAASNTGVDNIRQIIEKAQFTPVQCRYKVYIIDECHMLSVAAFNALLKTLEEPPDRVIFVLVTTDPQRVLPTIISRCQRFDYRRIPIEPMVGHLSKIAYQEAIDIADEALTLVAQIANGGLRDAESLLDQLSLLSGTITSEKVWDLVGAVSEQDLLKLLRAIASDTPESVIDNCRYLMNRGREPLVVLQYLAGFYLNLLIAKTAPNRPDIAAVTAATWQALSTEAQKWKVETILQGQQRLKESEVQLRNTTQPRLWLEVTLLSLLPSACHSQTVLKSDNEIEVRREEVIDKTQEITLTISPLSNNTSQMPRSSQHSNISQAENTRTDTRINANEIWSSVLGKLQPFPQDLVRSNCHLLNLDESAAYIEVRSQGLLKLVQGKISDLEAAFLEVCQRPIKVNLKVASSFNRTSSSPQTIQPLPSNLPPISNDRTSRSINSQPISHSHHSKSNNNDSTSCNSQSEIKLQPQLETHCPEKKTDLTDISGSIAVEEIEKAAKSLAKIFDGEIIDLSYKSHSESSNHLEKNLEVSRYDSSPLSQPFLGTHKVKKSLITETIGQQQSAIRIENLDQTQSSSDLLHKPFLGELEMYNEQVTESVNLEKIDRIDAISQEVKSNLSALDKSFEKLRCNKRTTKLKSFVQGRPEVIENEEDLDF
ncbi:MAG: DNA polymerase III subunit gamma/tau [cyanobacterium endosymbiont of Rhopalodia musculus]|uniref:DNA polymerase III subunit gamma/tau n=1 Tax=cyanobacterium endosymbiont of Epithemia clementina EcSB TaxID=3034674 RepID=UPI00248011D5|nr:DNA polymerase III subunit gamma/tau [cyanobacterium endosymbiont of Epithemia clementina EcSB]WGT68210.1 DNA polymerase III subunit gamma/tau [cyanobacterium endosymbiont of Epithemia clementina EcSB]